MSGPSEAERRLSLQTNYVVLGWGSPDEAGSVPVGVGGAAAQHLLAVSDSNRDPLKDEHNRVGPLGQLASGSSAVHSGDPRRGSRRGEYEETRRKNTWLCLQLWEEELARSISDTECSSDDGS